MNNHWPSTAKKKAKYRSLISFFNCVTPNDNLGCKVAGGKEFTQNLKSLRLGRCDNGAAAGADNATDPAVVPSSFASASESLDFFKAIGIPATEAAALSATSTLDSTKMVTINDFPTTKEKKKAEDH
jgi:hypothetical protein